MRSRFSVRRFVSVLIALLPVLNLYEIGSLKMGFGDAALVLIVVVTLLIYGRHKMSIDLHRCHFIKYFGVFLVVSCVLMTARREPLYTDFIYKWGRLIIYAYILDIVSQHETDFHIICKTSLWVAVLLSVVLIVQVLVNALFHIGIYPYITFLPLNSDGGDASLIISMIESYRRTGGVRFSSVFAEPAHFAQCVLLPLTYALFENEKPFSDRKRAAAIMTITAAVVLSRSANGILIGAMVWVYFLWRTFKEKITVKKVFAFFFVVAGIILFLSTTDFFEKALYRVETVAVRDAATTGNGRLLQGLAVYARLSPFEKVIGLGFGNVGAYLFENRITTAFLRDIGNEYMNGFSTVLVSGGIIGLIWYLGIWFKLFRESRPLDKRMIFFVITLLFCTSAMFYSTGALYYLTAVRSNKYPSTRGRVRK